MRVRRDAGMYMNRSMRMWFQYDVYMSCIDGWMLTLFPFSVFDFWFLWFNSVVVLNLIEDVYYLFRNYIHKPLYFIIVVF